MRYKLVPKRCIKDIDDESDGRWFSLQYNRYNEPVEPFTKGHVVQCGDIYFVARIGDTYSTRLNRFLVAVLEESTMEIKIFDDNEGKLYGDPNAASDSMYEAVRLAGGERETWRVTIDCPVQVIVSAISCDDAMAEAKKKLERISNPRLIINTEFADNIDGYNITAEME